LKGLRSKKGFSVQVSGFRVKKTGDRAQMTDSDFLTGRKENLRSFRLSLVLAPFFIEHQESNIKHPVSGFQISGIIKLKPDT